MTLRDVSPRARARRSSTRAGRRSLPARFAAFALAALLLPSAAPADWVGTKVNRLFLDPDSIPVVLDGYQNGDIISYILETTPEASAGANKTEGFGAWATIYVPAGVEVVGAEVVELQPDGTFVGVPAKDMDAASDDCGKRGCRITILPNQIDNGFLNRAQQDTGIFYSTDLRTTVLAAPFTAPTPTGIKNPPQFWNVWDRDQDLAFGPSTALSGNSGKGNTAVVSTDGGTTWKGVGSPVAGPLTHYTNDYDPACDANGSNPGSTAFYDDIQCVGPWQRIAYPGAKMGYGGPVIPATGTTYPANIVNTAVPTGLGFALSPANPLPATTNAVRFVQGIRRVGQLETGRITFRITDAAALTAAFTSGTFCLDATGGDYGGPDRNSAQDNPWRYYEGDAHRCFQGDADAILFKAARFVNGLPSGGTSVISGDVVGYELTFYNTSNGTLTNIVLSDTPALNLTLLEPGASPNCPYASYDGNIPGPTYTAGSATAGTATWANIASLAPGASVTVKLCAQVDAGLTPGATAQNCGDVAWDPAKSAQSCAQGSVSNRITGTVYVDQDSSGGTAATAGDTPLAGVTVLLYRDDGDGIFNAGTDALVDTDVTGASGGYAFESVCVFEPGKAKCTKKATDTNDFWVVETDLFGYSSTGDSDTATGCAVAGDPCNVISVPLFHFDDASTGNDFFDIAPASLGDRVWLDTDGDGIQDVGEPGIPNVTVNLTGFGPDGLFGTGDDVVYPALTTGANGEYRFTALPPGSFRVDVDDATLPAGLSASPGTTDPLDVTLASGDTFNDADFGYYNSATNPSTGSALIGDEVWSDADGNGIRNAGESGIGGVTLDLLSAGADGILGTGDDVTAATATTAADGRYLFSGTASSPFHVTEYVIPPGSFTGTTYNLTLNQNLAADYFVIVQGSDGSGTGAGNRTPAEDYARLASDPFGTGDLGVSAGANVIGLQRQATFGGTSWSGVVTVVESVSSTTTAGFRLLDVKSVAHSGAAVSGTATSGTAWSNINQVMLMGGFNGAGCDTVDAQVGDHGSCWARVWPSGTNTINWTRDAGTAGSLETATSTTMVLEWGSEWTVQRTNVTGNNGGNGLALTTNYNTAALGTAVARANTWVWGTGHTNNNGIGDGAEAVVITIGDGVNKNATESTVAAANEYSWSAIDFEVYALTHAKLAVDHQFLADGNANALTADVSVAAAAGTDRMGLAYNSQNGTGTAYPRPMMSARYLNGSTVRLERRRSGQAFAAWVQGIDFSGFQTIAGIAPGDYIVDVTDTGGLLAGYTLTSGPQSNPDPTAPITVFAGDVYLRADFGYRDPALFSISDRVWYDANASGTLDGGESGVAGVSVDLLDVAGVVIATTVSDATGSFTFPGLLGGGIAYTIHVSDGGGVLNSYSGTTAPATNGQLGVTIIGTDVTGVNFGYNAAGTIGDTVFSDNNGNGVQDAGEPGIAGVTVQLWQDSDGNGVFDSLLGDGLLKSAVTDGAGRYLFTDLDPGTHFVSVDDTQAALSLYSPTTTDQETGANAPGTQIDVVLTTGISMLDADFGYRQTALPDVSGNVFNDLDRDGYDDGAGEPGFQSVTVLLLDANGVVVATTTTDANGDYLFPDVAAGSYTVAVTDDNNILAGYSLTSGLDAIPITVAAADIAGVDFGYVRESARARIGDHVWLDADRDGNQDPSETGLVGVTLNLYDAGPNGAIGGGDDTLVATTVTNVEGFYSFAGLTAGNYYVDLDGATLPPGLVTTTGTSDPTAIINLSAGELYPDADFGYAPTTTSLGAIGDRLWYDLDADGIQDAGEVGIPGVTVKLVGGACVGPTGCTVVTGANGSYLFSDLAADTYTVSVDTTTLPAGYNTTPTNGNVSRQYNLAAGDVVLWADFGFNGGTTGNIGDFVWFDENGDGIQTVGEVGIADVTINLLDNATGTILATTTTDFNGAYDFIGVPAGTYKIQVGDVHGVLTNFNLTTPPNPTGTITLSAGQNYDLADFGYTASAGVGSIGTLIWHDNIVNDGTFNPGAPEPGFQGVTVDLWYDTNGNGALEPGTDNLVRSALTRVGDGHYEFLGLPFGNYIVNVTDTFGVLSGFSLVPGPNPGIDNNSQANPYSTSISPANPVNVTADFGYIATTAFTISGLVFQDAAWAEQPGNGVFSLPNGDVRIPNISLELYRDLNGDGLVSQGDPRIATTTTDAFGAYQFTNLPAGQFVVVANVVNTRLEGLIQTTQTTTAGVQSVTLGPASTGNDFGFYAPGGIQTTPITLSYFKATATTGGRHFAWQTATEVGNIGFFVYERRGQQRVRLNDTPIRSAAVDSLEPQSYKTDIAGAMGSVFFLEDVDLSGHARMHGPFALDVEHGARVSADPIDWPAIRAEHQANSRKRALAQTQQRAGFGHAAAIAPAGARLGVTRDGLYRVTYENLAAAGVDFAGKRPSSLALTNRGEPVAIYVESPQRLFGPGAFIEFEGKASNSIYTGTNVYILHTDRRQRRRVRKGWRRANRRVSPAPFYMETVAVDRNRHYGFAAPNDDPWYDTGILAFTSPATADFPIDIDGYVSAAAPATLTVEMWGETAWPSEPDHHVVATFNGSSIADERFDGLANHPIQVTVPPEAMQEGANTLKLTLPGDTGVKWDLVNLDRYSLTYPRAFHARNGMLAFTAAARVFAVDNLMSPDVVVYRMEAKRRPRRLTHIDVEALADGTFQARFAGGWHGRQARYFVADARALLTPSVEAERPAVQITSGRADYLIISHPDFIAGLQPLVNVRTTQGLKVRVTDVDDVYARYSHGMIDPRAIRDYIAEAKRDMGTRFVLLVGGDTYDYRNYLGAGAMSFLPSLYTSTGDIVHFAPVDPLYADTDRDGVPDLALGRFPVRTAADLASMIQRTLAYESKSYGATSVFAAGRADGQMSFSQASDRLIAKLPGHWTAERAYIDQLDVDLARQTLLDAINAGVALTSFIGHSGPTQWSFEPFFHAADAGALTNAGRPTVVMQWGCWNTYYVAPKTNTLAHRFLLSGDRGAAAVLGASTLTNAHSEEALGHRLMPRLMRSGTTIGEAVLEAKRDLARTNPEATDVLLGWTLLGDPALAVTR